MRKNLLLGSGVVLFTASLALVVWQGSFTVEPISPASAEQTYVFWGLSTLVFLLTVLLGFLLFRTAVKLYIDRQRKRPGSHIRWKLVAGALALSIAPVSFLVLFSVEVLNRNLDKWFSRPAEQVLNNLEDVRRALIAESQEKVDAEAHWMASLPADAGTWRRFCAEHGIEQAEFSKADGSIETVCAPPDGPAGSDSVVLMATAPAAEGRLTISARMTDVLAVKRGEIDRYRAEYERLAKDRRETRRFYVLLLFLITLFILFFAMWLALFLSRLISIPITALLRAAEEVRGGNLAHRVEIGAIDELGLLVRAFNEMTAELESSRGELENRRRLTEAILESIPTGVLSLAADGSIVSVNRALKGILPEEQIARAAKISDLFSREDATEIRYLMNRARRTGVAGSQIELKIEGRTMQLSATVAALEERRSSGFVLVLEDTSEMLRAQRALAWQEVARRIAHEIKNPLTPIALSADRIARQLERSAAPEPARRILEECSQTILREVETVRTLVDEFSQFSRFPAAQPVASDLNGIVENALAVFEDRLLAIRVRRELAAGLPQVNVDPEQFKRVIVNLVDNAAEAMQDSPVKELLVATSASEAETVELTIADTGCGVSREDREKLFLPYFSTKGRGTGLGLAIVNRILTDHNAAIRVEDNAPSGARFIIDVPVAGAARAEMTTAETNA
ncbi:MAG TPA: ATP-binding protein [Bryobacteraceae bacterium]|nr:ATP-binding protein [Bryobacteraceae bacterium]